jgi:hypothetical protein
MKVKHHGRRTTSGRGPEIPKPDGVSRWRAKEEALLGNVTDEEAARRLQRTLAAVIGRRFKLGIPKPNPCDRRLTPEPDAWLGKMPYAEVAKRTGHPVGSVRTRRHKRRVANPGRRKPWLP